MVLYFVEWVLKYIYEFACRVLPFYEVSFFVASAYILSHALVEKRSLATVTLWPAILVVNLKPIFDCVVTSLRPQQQLLISFIFKVIA